MSSGLGINSALNCAIPISPPQCLTITEGEFPLFLYKEFTYKKDVDNELGDICIIYSADNH